MFQKIKNRLVILSTILMLGAPAAVPVAVYAQDIDDNLCSGANLDVTGGSTDCTTNATPETFQAKLAKFIDLISIVIGVIAVIMIIFGGFRYMTSGGDATKVTGAKNTILYALIGLIVVALAQIIVQFVLNTTEDI